MAEQARWITPDISILKARSRQRSLALRGCRRSLQSIDGYPRVRNRRSAIVLPRHYAFNARIVELPARRIDVLLRGVSESGRAGSIPPMLRSAALRRSSQPISGRQKKISLWYRMVVCIWCHSVHSLTAAVSTSSSLTASRMRRPRLWILLLTTQERRSDVLARGRWGTSILWCRWTGLKHERIRPQQP